jgi:hypothetical protein
MIHNRENTKTITQTYTTKNNKQDTHKTTTTTTTTIIIMMIVIISLLTAVSTVNRLQRKNHNK